MQTRTIVSLKHYNNYDFEGSAIFLRSLLVSSEIVVSYRILQEKKFLEEVKNKISDY